MGNRGTTLAVTRMPNPGCGACHGLGTIGMTAHFYRGNVEFDAPCWECFGRDVSLSLPKPGTTDNA